MTDALTALGLEVGRAQLDNDNGSMMDTFFVQKLNGKKIESGAPHTLSQPCEWRGSSREICLHFHLCGDSVMCGGNSSCTWQASEKLHKNAEAAMGQVQV